MDSDARITCPRCNGDGFITFRSIGKSTQCAICSGTGEVVRRDGFDEYERTTAKERFRDREAERDAERRKE